MLRTRTVSWLMLALAGLLVSAAPAAAQKKTLVVALNQDPDLLDPTLSRTYVGRIIFAHMCEKLYEIDENLRISPQLAAALPTISDAGKTVTIKLRTGVKFNDGTAMNADAVKFSLDRHREMKGSNRRSELEPVTAVEVVDPLTIRLRLKSAFSPLVATLADRSGMPISPTAANKLGDKFATAPVCVGPWSFVERVPQDRIVLEKSTHYFDPGQARFDRLVFRIIPDDNVRVANLRSGDIDFMHQVAPTDSVNLKKEGRFEVASVTGIAYRASPSTSATRPARPSRRRSGHPAGERPPVVREAFDLASTRGTQPGVWDGQYTAGCTPISTVSPFHDKSASARAATWPSQAAPRRGRAPNGYSFELTIVNDPQARRVEAR